MLLPLAGCGVGAPARPGPHNVGAVGPSAPPARSAALRPALPARPRLRRRPCRAALPTHLPPGVAAPRGSRWPACGPRQAAPRALAPPPAGGKLTARLRRLFGSRRARAAISTAARTGSASAAFPRASRAAGRRERRLRAGMPAVAPAGKAKASPAQGGKPPTSGGLACRVPGQRWANVAGVPPCAGLPPLLILVNGGAFYVCCCLSCVWLRSCLVAGLPVWRCLWLVSRPACPVSLAVRSGGGVCLSAGGGLCVRVFLACWCSCWPSGAGASLPLPARINGHFAEK